MCKLSYMVARLYGEAAIRAGSGSQRHALCHDAAACRIRRRLHPPVFLPAPREPHAVCKLAAPKAVPLVLPPATCGKPHHASGGSCAVLRSGKLGPCGRVPGEGCSSSGLQVISSLTLVDVTVCILAGAISAANTIFPTAMVPGMQPQSECLIDDDLVHLTLLLCTCPEHRPAVQTSIHEPSHAVCPAHLSPLAYKQLPVPWRRPSCHRPSNLSPLSSKHLPAMERCHLLTAEPCSLRCVDLA
jgi:hypothetical protein